MRKDDLRDLFPHISHLNRGPNSNDLQTKGWKHTATRAQLLATMQRSLLFISGEIEGCVCSSYLWKRRLYFVMAISIAGSSCSTKCKRF